jgi:hypothetical protein
VTVDPPDPRAITYYFQGGIASLSATETDTSGLAGVVNVVPGTVTLTVTPRALGKPSSVGRVHVRQGTLSVRFMYPSPGLSQGDQ